MPRVFALIVLIFAASSFAGSCSQAVDPDAPCFDETRFSTDKADVFYDKSGTTREVMFVFKDVPEDICPEEHITVKYEVFNGSAGIEFDTMLKVGKISWPPSYERKETLTSDPQDGNHFLGTEPDIGLKQAFPNKGQKGYVGLSISIYFPSRGDRATDSTYLARYDPSGRVTLTYHPSK